MWRLILGWGSDDAAGLFGGRSEIELRTEDYFQGLFKFLKEWRSELDGSFQVKVLLLNRIHDMRWNDGRRAPRGTASAAYQVQYRVCRQVDSDLTRIIHDGWSRNRAVA